jgi:hypothetical protein
MLQYTRQHTDTMPKRNPTCFRLASDLATREQVWVSSNPLTGKGHPAALIAGVFAEHHAQEAIDRLPTFG